MKADGSILIDTKILDDGMEKGFELIKDEMASVGITAKQVGEQIELSFSKMDVSKPIANAVAKVEQLEQQLASVTSDYQFAVSEGDDKSAERMAAKRIALYDRLESARERLSIELAQAVQKEAAAEERATERKIKAAEKESRAKQRIAEKQYRNLTKPVRRFNSRLREILSGALVFNLLSAGLRKMTSYFGAALAANTEYSSSLSALRGSLMAAFQPIYEFVLPAIITLIDWLNAAAQVTGRFFAALTGKNYSQMQKNAQALNKEAQAIGGVGDAAEKAAKQIMGFDEINRLDSTKNTIGGGAAGIGAPLFEEISIPNEWEKVIDSLAMRIKDIFFEWDNLNPEVISEKLITALNVIAGGLIGFALGGPGGALVGMAIGAGIGVVISSVVFDGDGNLDGEEFMSALTIALTGMVGGLMGFFAGGPTGAAIGIIVGAGLGVKLSSIMFDGDGKLSASEIIKSLVSGLSLLAGTIIGFSVGGPAGAAVGAVVGLALGFSIQAIDFDGVGNAIKQMLSSVRDYFSSTFANGFVNGLAIMVNDGIGMLWNFFVNFVNSVISNWNRIWGGISQYHTSGTIGTQSRSVATYARTPEIPHLAKGAVIPPNKKFMAVLGDQKHGTNVEAPLETIKQALREELGGLGINVDVNFTGSLAYLAQILAPEIHSEIEDMARAGGW